jgi:protein phosphatase
VVLTHKHESPAQGDQEESDDAIPLRRRRVLAAVIAAVVLVLLALGLGLGYAWTQTRYYVGESNGRVAVYAGVSQSLGPIQLSHVYRETDVNVSSLPEFSQQRVHQTVPATGLDDAQQIIIDLQLGTQEHPCPTPPSASPSATRTPSPAPGSTAAAAPSASPSHAPARPSPSATSSAGPSSCTGGAQ